MHSQVYELDVEFWLKVKLILRSWYLLILIYPGTDGGRIKPDSGEQFSASATTAGKKLHVWSVCHQHKWINHYILTSKVDFYLENL